MPRRISRSSADSMRSIVASNMPSCSARFVLLALYLQTTSARATADEALRVQVRAAHARSRRTYGEPRVHEELRAACTRIARKRVARLMREDGLSARRHRQRVRGDGLDTRHRLNRGGDRQANNALWTIALIRMRSDPRTRTYVERRQAEGQSRKEVMRCLKRYLARELYPLILADLGAFRPAALT